MPRDSLFRVRPRNVRTGGAELPRGGGQRQPERAREAGTGRPGDARDVQGRQREARGGNISNEIAAEVRAVVESLGIRSRGAQATADLLAWYYERGIYIVPAKLWDKMPSLSWRELASETEPRQPVDALGWFESATPHPKGPPHKNHKGPGETNFAVLCGGASGGLVVIDFDDEEKGREFPLNTLTVATGKGIHYYVRVTDASVSNRSFPLAKLDIRGQGGIAIVPPSVHPTGRIYRFDNDKPIATMAEAQLANYLRGVLGDAEAFAPEGQAHAPGWFEEALGVTCLEGARNDTMARIAGRLLAARLHDTEVIALLTLWAEARCDPHLPTHEILACVRSLGRRHREEEQVQAAAESSTGEEPLKPGRIFAEVTSDRGDGGGEREPDGSDVRGSE